MNLLIKKRKKEHGHSVTRICKFFIHIRVSQRNITSYRYSNSLQQWAEDPDRKHHEDEEIEGKKESLAEREDAESEAAIQKARGWDDFKDGKFFEVNGGFLINVLECSKMQK